MQPQWKGGGPQRFYGGRKTFQIQNQISSGFSFHEPNIPHQTGIRSFSPSPSVQYQYRPHMRTFQQQYTHETKQIDLRGIKHVQLPTQKQRYRAQRVHVKGGEQTINQINLRGLKPFDEANKSRDKYYKIEDEMQKKGRLEGIQSLRNSIGLRSLGDKAYKYPEYSSNFYTGGLIPGSTHKPRQSEIIPQIKRGSVLTRPNWDVVLQLEEKREEKKILDSIDNWEQTTLKQNKPKWNDPDTFFQREQVKQGNKEIKKGGKK